MSAFDYPTAQEPTEQPAKTKEELYKEVESMYTFIKSSLDHREEPFEEFKKFSAFLQQVIENPDIISGYEKPFYEDVTGGILK